MKTRRFLRALMVLALLASALPALPDEKPAPAPAALPAAPSSWGDDPYYEDYDDDFHYTRRLRRFHSAQARQWGYYDPYFTNDVYFVIGTPYWYAWNNWYNPWAQRSRVVITGSRRHWIYTETYVYTNGWNPWGYPVAVYYSDWNYRGFYDPYWYDFSWSPWDWGWTSWSGYNRGYRRGYWNGYNDGYRNGWQNGWQNGYCVGYLNGSSNRSGAGYASDYWYRRNDPGQGVSQRPIIRPRTTTQGIAIPQPGLPNGRQGIAGPGKGGSPTPAAPAPDLRESARTGNGQVAPRASLPGSTPGTNPPARDEWSRSPAQTAPRSPSTGLPPRAGSSSDPRRAETPASGPNRILPAPPSRTPETERATPAPATPYTRTAPQPYAPRTNPYTRPAPPSSESARPAPRVETPSYNRPSPAPESRPRVETPSYNRPLPAPESRPRVETPSYNRPSPAPESRPRVETPSYNRPSPAPESRPRVETPSSRPSPSSSPAKGSPSAPSRPSGPGKGGSN